MLSACNGSSNAFFSKGSFTASGAASGSVSASFTGMSSYMERANQAPVLFTIAANNGDRTSTVTFTSPGDVTTYTVTAFIDFTGPPATGMTLTNTARSKRRCRTTRETPGW